MRHATERIKIILRESNSLVLHFRMTLGLFGKASKIEFDETEKINKWVYTIERDEQERENNVRL